MHFNLDVLTKQVSTPELAILTIFNGVSYTDEDRLLRLHLYRLRSEAVRIVYLLEDARVPCRDRGSKWIHHGSLSDCSLASPGCTVQLDGEVWTVVRRLRASQAFMKEVNPDHFLLGLHDANLDTSLQDARA